MQIDRRCTPTTRHSPPEPTRRPTRSPDTTCRTAGTRPRSPPRTPPTHRHRASRTPPHFTGSPLIRSVHPQYAVGRRVQLSGSPLKLCSGARVDARGAPCTWDWSARGRGAMRASTVLGEALALWTTASTDRAIQRFCWDVPVRPAVLLRRHPLHPPPGPAQTRLVAGPQGLPRSPQGCVRRRPRPRFTRATSRRSATRGASGCCRLRTSSRLAPRHRHDRVGP